MVLSVTCFHGVRKSQFMSSCFYLWSLEFWHKWVTFFFSNLKTSNNFKSFSKQLFAIRRYITPAIHTQEMLIIWFNVRIFKNVFNYYWYALLKHQIVDTALNTMLKRLTFNVVINACILLVVFRDWYTCLYIFKIISNNYLIM